MLLAGILSGCFPAAKQMDHCNGSKHAGTTDMIESLDMASDTRIKKG